MTQEAELDALRRSAATAPSGDLAATQLNYAEGRLRHCLRLIEATKESSESEKRALVFMLGEEFSALMARLWRAAR